MEPKILSKNKAKEVKKLHIKKYRETSRLFIAEGKKCITDLSKAFTLEEVFVSPSFIDNFDTLKKSCKNVWLDKDNNLLKEISGLTTPTDIIAVFRMPEKNNTLLELARKKCYLLLDEIQDPGNLGTIIRTCDWFGIYDIFASHGTVDVYNPKVVQATMGSLSRVRVTYMDLDILIEKNKDIPLYGTFLNGKPLSECNPEQKGMILMGNEGKGISPHLAQKIKEKITIPAKDPNDHPDSLNVAVATAIIVSHFQMD